VIGEEEARLVRPPGRPSENKPPPGGGFSTAAERLGTQQASWRLRKLANVGKAGKAPSA
jgi:hypothetical protein